MIRRRRRRRRPRLRRRCRRVVDAKAKRDKHGKAERETTI